MNELTQEQIDEKYPLWKCEMRAYHEYEDANGYTAHIYKVWRDHYGESREYMFSCDTDRAHSVCKALNRNSCNWKPKYNAIGALIN